MTRPEMMDAAMHDLLAMVADGSLKPVGGGRYPMTAVREAHQDLLARRTTGKLVLDPRRQSSRLVQSSESTAPSRARKTPVRTNQGLMSFGSVV